MEKWNKIVEILHNKPYQNSDLRIILRRWCKILGNSIVIPNEQDKIYRTINNVLRMLKVRVGQEGHNVFLEILRCLLHDEVFGIDDLNQLLIDMQLPYHYILGGNVLLQNGMFKQGYKEEGDKMIERAYDRIFISHSYEDRDKVKPFVELLEDMGIGIDEIFYSSLAEYGVSLGENIVDAIKKEFTDKKIYVVFMLSHNYYSSVMCLNEMGAVWVMQHAYSTILLPGYEYKEIKGAIDAGRIGIKLDGDQSELKSRLIEFRNQIQQGFCLPKMDERVWNRKLNSFIKKMEK